MNIRTIQPLSLFQEQNLVVFFRSFDNGSALIKEKIERKNNEFWTIQIKFYSLILLVEFLFLEFYVVIWEVLVTGTTGKGERRVLQTIKETFCWRRVSLSFALPSSVVDHPHSVWDVFHRMQACVFRMRSKSKDNQHGDTPEKCLKTHSKSKISTFSLILSGLVDLGITTISLCSWWRSIISKDWSSSHALHANLSWTLFVFLRQFLN